MNSYVIHGACNVTCYLTVTVEADTLEQAVEIAMGEDLETPNEWDGKLWQDGDSEILWIDAEDLCIEDVYSEGGELLQVGPSA